MFPAPVYYNCLTQAGAGGEIQQRDLCLGMGRNEDSPLTSRVTLTCASVKTSIHKYFQYHEATGMALSDTSKQSADTDHSADPLPSGFAYNQQQILLEVAPGFAGGQRTWGNPG